MGIREAVQPGFHLVWRTVRKNVEAMPADGLEFKPQVLSALSQAGDRFLASLGGLTDEEAARIVRVPWGAEMAQGVVVAAEVPHMFYHNGQLAIYMRMRGVKPLFLER